jgi:SAM-dependent methyltransferase
MSCCTSGLDEVFTEDKSRKEAKRYLKRGLPPRARKLVKAIAATTALAGKRTLEVGVGAGALTVEMLRRGARHATGIDAVQGQLNTAQYLAREAAVSDRFQVMLGDFTEFSQLEHADIVVLDRVVCCYPRWQPLLGSAAAHAEQVIALTYPRDTWYMRMVARAINFTRALRRTKFRFWIHSPAAMQALLRERGFTARKTDRYLIWEVLVAARS